MVQGKNYEYIITWLSNIKLDSNNFKHIVLLISIFISIIVLYIYAAQIHVRIGYLFFHLPHKGVESNDLPRDSDEIKSYFNMGLLATFKS